MSSDSEHSEAEVPSDVVLEKTLRGIVRKGIEPLTVNTVRAAAEESLGLTKGFFKTHGEWKEKSKEIINEAFNEPASQKSPSPSPPKAVSSRPVKATTRKAPTSTAQNPPRKRQKRAVSSPDLSENGGDEVVEKSEDEQSAERSQDENMNPADDSESEMSVVLDEAPPKKQRQKKSAGSDANKSKAKSKAKPTKTKKAPANTKDLTADEAEIKRLQGWLLKCGIRKLWHRELAPYDSEKAKIKHLKDMLKDVGMEGRYSEQKASAIKERRELAADLEAVQEGEKQWGNKDDSSSEAESRPRRRGAAARFVDFGDEDEDDE